MSPSVAQAEERFRTLVTSRIPIYCLPSADSILQIGGLDEYLQVLIDAASNNADNERRVSDLELKLEVTLRNAHNTARNRESWKSYSENLVWEINKFRPDSGTKESDIQELFLDVTKLVALNGLSGFDIWAKGERRPGQWICLAAVLGKREQWVDVPACVCVHGFKCIQMRPVDPESVEDGGTSVTDKHAMIRRRE
jgi:hypothetical protein